LEGDGAIPFFQQFLHSRRRLFFGGKQDEDAALSAVVGLSTVATAAARKVLEAGVGNRSKRVSDACTNAINELDRVP